MGYIAKTKDDDAQILESLRVCGLEEEILDDIEKIDKDTEGEVSISLRNLSIKIIAVFRYIRGKNGL